jgi:hypothetical protein
MSVLPAPTLPLHSVLDGRVTVPLSASRGFASGGFAGTVQSNLAIRLGRPGRWMTAQTGNATASHEVEVSYRATLAGSVVEHVRGNADPGVCTLLGSCGLEGTLTLEPRVTSGRADLYAIASARRPYRDLLTAVGVSTRGNAKGILTTGSVSWNRGGVLASDLGQGSTSCHDSAPLGSGAIFLGVHRRHVDAQYSAGFGTFAVRTRCPGPEARNGATLATGEIPLTQLRRRTIKLSLNSGATSQDYGYDVRATAHLTLTLTRVRVTTGARTSNVFNSGGTVFAVGL